MYADKFHTKANPPRFLTAGAYARYLGGFGEEKVERFRAFQAELGTPDLDALAERYRAPVEGA